MIQFKKVFRAHEYAGIMPQRMIPNILKKPISKHIFFHAKQTKNQIGRIIGI
jgi:hypothetical protein